MKSAYELAMERLQKKDGATVALTGAQKAAIAEIESQTRARLAEIEIMQGRELAEARAKGDAAEVEKLTARKVDTSAGPASGARWRRKRFGRRARIDTKIV